jgi:hypothetical protein
MDGTKSSAQLAEIAGYTGGGDVEGTVKTPMPATGRSTVYVASDMLGDKNEAMRTYVHETGNALAMQQFAKGNVSGAYLGARGGPPTAGQRGSRDPDIGNQLERCVLGPPVIHAAPTTITVTPN